MRILFVLENFHPHIGGVEVVFGTLTRGLAKLGHAIDVITHQFDGTERFERWEGVNIYRVPCLQSRYLFSLAALPLAIRLARKADIIHTTTFNGAPPAWLAARITGKKVLITVHEVWIGRWGELTGMKGIAARFHDLLERLIYLFRYDHYATPSRSTKHMLIKAIGKKRAVSVIYNGLDYEHFDPSRYKKEAKSTRKALGMDEHYVCFTYGRPGISKGIEYAIMAFPKIAENIPSARLVLMLSKDPAYKERYRWMKQLIKDYGIEGKTTLLPPTPWKELPRFIMAADCVIVPSLAEGFGYTAAEACALGRPLVATDTTSIPEVVCGRVVLVPPRDPAAIARAVMRQFQGSVKPLPMKRFTWDEHIRQTITVYGSLMR